MKVLHGKRRGQGTRNPIWLKQGHKREQDRLQRKKEILLATEDINFRRVKALLVLMALTEN